MPLQDLIEIAFGIMVFLAIVVQPFFPRRYW